ncbi:dynein regulator [Pyrrhoderma noxium]|uniref:Nuclear distribution protein PAC1 n=1 Tax=Pyrrhoderma noxium TaxID=2282107 RepID=A0A286UWC6_9AGAM|nr:dynein regulator [Pyrrhoderma noxium]
MSLLSERQKEELHKSILEYLHSQNFTEAYIAFKEETNTDYTPDPKSKYAQLLEKKWTSVIRLQKKIMDLENRNAALQEEVSISPARRAASQSDWVPRAPAGRVLTGHRSEITKVAFHPAYSILASASNDATIKIWDWETGEFERTLKGHTRAVNDIDFDSRGNLLVSCAADLFIKIWDTQNEWKNTKTMAGHDHSISSVRFMPGDEFIVSAGRDRTIRVWNVGLGHQVRLLNGHNEWVRCVTPSDDGRLLASCSNDHTGRIWDYQSGETKVELRGHENVIEAIVFAPSNAYPAIRELGGIVAERSKVPGLYAATGGRDKYIKIWDTTNGQLIRTLPGHDNWVRALVFHPNGKFLLSCADDKTIRVWELSTGRCVKTVEAHGHFVQSMAWGRATTGGGSAAAGEGGASATRGVNGSADGEEPKRVNVVATGSVDQTVKVWTP